MLLDSVADVLTSRFAPAGEGQASHMFSTPEVKEAIVKFCPGVDISEREAYDLMIRCGFCCTLQRGTGLNFKWMLIEK